MVGVVVAGLLLWVEMAPQQQVVQEATEHHLLFLVLPLLMPVVAVLQHITVAHRVLGGLAVAALAQHLQDSGMLEPLILVAAEVVVAVILILMAGLGVVA
jgi:hypothetical protein